VKSVRLGNDLEQRLEKAARITGLPASQIIRDAVREQCDKLLAENLSDQLADVIGAVGSGGSTDSRRTGRQFTETLKRSSARNRNKTT
jgi:predicted DNA-binding protein